ncbi:MAG: hypothetical protein K8963_09770 [Proteobacteria bacterium]|nr:hypothetical protein [Pseudomonadota bacterium]
MVELLLGLGMVLPVLVQQLAVVQPRLAVRLVLGPLPLEERLVPPLALVLAPRRAVLVLQEPLLLVVRRLVVFSA